MNLKAFLDCAEARCSLRTAPARRVFWSFRSVVPLLVAAAAFTPNWAQAADDVPAVANLIPAEFPLAIIARDMNKLDKTLESVFKKFPDANYSSFLAELKGEIGVGEWIDFSSPVGIGQPTIVGGGTPAIWVRIPDFASKVKEKAKPLTDAKEIEGVWNLTFEEKEPLFAKARGDYVLITPNPEMLAQAIKVGKSLGEELKARAEFVRGRDAFVHLNIESVRPMALGGIAQGAQMAPMFAMMAAQGGSGMDPTLMTGIITAVFDSAKKFVEQISYVEVGLSVSEMVFDLTLTTGYGEGAIKQFLKDQKPATIALVPDIETGPYIALAGFHMPGDKSPFVDYLFGQMKNAAPAAQPPSGAEGQGAGAAPSPMTTAVQLTCDLYRKIEGGTSAVLASPGGAIRITGEHVGKDAKGILDLFKQNMTAANSLMSQMGGGMKYEASGSRKVGNVEVEEFAMRMDPANPAAGMLTKIYGENVRTAMGLVDGKVRYCTGTEDDVAKTFTGKVASPLASNEHVKEALAALPAKRNAVLLLDIATALGTFGPMFGAVPPGANVPPGPPVALSVSLCGEPARVDIHVPVKAIERILQVMQPQGGM